ncbi:hypothetical protein ScPMuIL_016459 [Solemya velum]
MSRLEAENTLNRLPAGDPLPSWSNLPLDAKFPMVRNPKGSVVLYTTDLCHPKHRSSKGYDFDLTDPYGYSMSSEYQPLHDGHLLTHFSPVMRKHLVEKKFITKEGKVICTLKEFNQYRQYLRRICLMEMAREKWQAETKRGLSPPVSLPPESKTSIQDKIQSQHSLVIQRLREKEETKKSKFQLALRQKSESLAKRLAELRNQRLLQRIQRRALHRTREENVIEHYAEIQRRNQQFIKRWRRRDRLHNQRLRDLQEHRIKAIENKNRELWETRKRVQQERIEKDSKRKKVEDEKRLKNISEREQSINKERENQNAKLHHLKRHAKERHKQREDMYAKRLTERLAAGTSASFQTERYCYQRQKKTEKNPFNSVWTLDDILQRLNTHETKRGMKSETSFLEMLNAAIDNAVDIVVTESQEECEFGDQERSDGIVQQVVSKVTNEIYPTYLNLLNGPARSTVQFCDTEDIIPSPLEEANSDKLMHFKSVSDHVMTPMGSPINLENMSVSGEDEFPSGLQESTFVEKLLKRLLSDLQKGRLSRQELMKLANYSLEIIKNVDSNESEREVDIADKLVEFTVSKILDDIKSGEISNVEIAELSDSMLESQTIRGDEESNEEEMFMESLNEEKLDKFIEDTMKTLAATDDMESDSLVNVDLLNGFIQDTVRNLTRVESTAAREEDFIINTLKKIINDIQNARLNNSQIRDIAAAVTEDVHGYLPEVDTTAGVDIKHVVEKIIEDLHSGAIDPKKSNTLVRRLISKYHSVVTQSCSTLSSGVTSLLAELITQVADRIRDGSVSENEIQLTKLNTISNVITSQEFGSETLQKVTSSFIQQVLSSGSMKESDVALDVVHCVFSQLAASESGLADDVVDKMLDDIDIKESEMVTSIVNIVMVELDADDSEIGRVIVDGVIRALSHQDSTVSREVYDSLSKKLDPQQPSVLESFAQNAVERLENRESDVAEQIVKSTLSCIPGLDITSCLDMVRSSFRKIAETDETDPYVSVEIVQNIVDNIKSDGSEPTTVLADSILAEMQETIPESVRKSESDLRTVSNDDQEPRVCNSRSADEMAREILDNMCEKNSQQVLKAMNEVLKTLDRSDEAIIQAASKHLVTNLYQTSPDFAAALATDIWKSSGETDRSSMTETIFQETLSDSSKEDIGRFSADILHDLEQNYIEVANDIVKKVLQDLADKDTAISKKSIQAIVGNLDETYFAMAKVVVEGVFQNVKDRLLAMPMCGVGKTSSKHTPNMGRSESNLGILSGEDEKKIQGTGDETKDQPMKRAVENTSEAKLHHESSVDRIVAKISSSKLTEVAVSEIIHTLEKTNSEIAQEVVGNVLKNIQACVSSSELQPAVLKDIVSTLISSSERVISEVLAKKTSSTMGKLAEKMSSEENVPSGSRGELKVVAQKIENKLLTADQLFALAAAISTADAAYVPSKMAFNANETMSYVMNNILRSIENKTYSPDRLQELSQTLLTSYSHLESPQVRQLAMMTIVLDNILKQLPSLMESCGLPLFSAIQIHFIRGDLESGGMSHAMMEDLCKAVTSTAVGGASGTDLQASLSQVDRMLLSNQLDESTIERMSSSIIDIHNSTAGEHNVKMMNKISSFVIDGLHQVNEGLTRRSDENACVDTIESTINQIKTDKLSSEHIISLACTLSKANVSTSDLAISGDDAFAFSLNSLLDDLTKKKSNVRTLNELATAVLSTNLDFEDLDQFVLERQITTLVGSILRHVADVCRATDVEQFDSNVDLQRIESIAQQIREDKLTNIDIVALGESISAQYQVPSIVGVPEGDVISTLLKLQDDLFDDKTCLESLRPIITKALEECGEDIYMDTDKVTKLISMVLRDLLKKVKQGDLNEKNVQQLAVSVSKSFQSPQNLDPSVTAPETLKKFMTDLLMDIEHGKLSESEIQEIGRAMVENGHKLLDYELSAAEENPKQSVSICSSLIADTVVDDLMNSMQQEIDQGVFNADSLVQLGSCILKAHSLRISTDNMQESSDMTQMPLLTTDSKMATDVIISTIQVIRQEAELQPNDGEHIAAIANSVASAIAETPSLRGLEVLGVDNENQALMLTIQNVTKCLNEDNVSLVDAQKIFSAILKQYPFDRRTFGGTTKVNSPTEEPHSQIIRTLIRETIDKIERDIQSSDTTENDVDSIYSALGMRVFPVYDVVLFVKTLVQQFQEDVTSGTVSNEAVNQLLRVIGTEDSTEVSVTPELLSEHLAGILDNIDTFGVASPFIQNSLKLFHIDCNQHKEDINSDSEEKIKYLEYLLEVMTSPVLTQFIKMALRSVLSDMNAHMNVHKEPIKELQEVISKELEQVISDSVEYDENRKTESSKEKIVKTLNQMRGECSTSENLAREVEDIILETVRSEMQSSHVLTECIPEEREITHFVEKTLDLIIDNLKQDQIDAFAVSSAVSGVQGEETKTTSSLISKELLTEAASRLLMLSTSAQTKTTSADVKESGDGVTSPREVSSQELDILIKQTLSNIKADEFTRQSTLRSGKISSDETHKVLETQPSTDNTLNRPLSDDVLRKLSIVSSGHIETLVRNTLDDITVGALPECSDTSLTVVSYHTAIVESHDMKRFILKTLNTIQQSLEQLQSNDLEKAIHHVCNMRIPPASKPLVMLRKLKEQMTELGIVEFTTETIEVVTEAIKSDSVDVSDIYRNISAKSKDGTYTRTKTAPIKSDSQTPSDVVRIPSTQTSLSTEHLVDIASDIIAAQTEANILVHSGSEANQTEMENKPSIVEEFVMNVIQHATGEQNYPEKIEVLDSEELNRSVLRKLSEIRDDVRRKESEELLAKVVDVLQVDSDGVATEREIGEFVDTTLTYIMESLKDGQLKAGEMCRLIHEISNETDSSESRKETLLNAIPQGTMTEITSGILSAYESSGVEEVDQQQSGTEDEFQQIETFVLKTIDNIKKDIVTENIEAAKRDELKSSVVVDSLAIKQYVLKTLNEIQTSIEKLKSNNLVEAIMEVCKQSVPDVTEPLATLDKLKKQLEELKVEQFAKETVSAMIKSVEEDTVKTIDVYRKMSSTSTETCLYKKSSIVIETSIHSKTGICEVGNVHAIAPNVAVSTEDLFEITTTVMEAHTELQMTGNIDAATLDQSSDIPLASACKVSSSLIETFVLNVINNVKSTICESQPDETKQTLMPDQIEVVDVQKASTENQEPTVDRQVSEAKSSHIEHFVLKKLDDIKDDITEDDIIAKRDTPAVVDTADMKQYILKTLNELQDSLLKIQSNTFVDAISALCQTSSPPVCEPLKTLEALKTQLDNLGVQNFAKETVSLITTSVEEDRVKTADVYRVISSTLTETGLYVRSSSSVDINIRNSENVNTEDQLGHHVSANVSVSTHDLVQITSSIMQVHTEIQMVKRKSSTQVIPVQSVTSASSSIVEQFILNVLQETTKQVNKDQETLNSIPNSIEITDSTAPSARSKHSAVRDLHRSVSDVKSSHIETFIRKELDDITDTVSKEIGTERDTASQSEAVVDIHDMKQYILKTLNELQEHLHKIQSNNFIDAISSLCQASVPCVSEPLTTLDLLKTQLTSLGVAEFARETVSIIVDNIESEDVKTDAVYRCISATSTKSCLYVRSSSSIIISQTNTSGFAKDETAQKHSVSPNVSLSTHDLVEITSSIMQVHTEIQLRKDTSETGIALVRSVSSVSSSIVEGFVLSVLKKKSLTNTPNQPDQSLAQIPTTIKITNSAKSDKSTDQNLSDAVSEVKSNHIETFVRKELNSITASMAEEQAPSSETDTNSTAVIHTSDMKLYILKTLNKLQDCLLEIQSNNFVDAITAMCKTCVPTTHEPLSTLITLRNQLDSLGVEQFARETNSLIIASVETEEVKAVDVYKTISSTRTESCLYIRSSSSLEVTQTKQSSLANSQSGVRHDVSPNVSLSTYDLVQITSSIMQVHTEMEMTKDKANEAMATSSLCSVSSSIVETFVLNVLKQSKDYSANEVSSELQNTIPNKIEVTDSASNTMRDVHPSASLVRSSQIETFVRKELNMILTDTPSGKCGATKSSSISGEHSSMGKLSPSVSDVKSSLLETFVRKKLQDISATSSGDQIRTAAEADTQTVHMTDMKTYVVKVLVELQSHLKRIESNSFVEAVNSICQASVPAINQPLQTLKTLMSQLQEIGIADFAQETVSVLINSVESETVQTADVYRKVSSTACETCLYIRSTSSVKIEISNHSSTSAASDEMKHNISEVMVSTENLVEVTSSLVQVHSEVQMLKRVMSDVETDAHTLRRTSSSLLETFILEVLHISMDHSSSHEVPDKIEVMIGPKLPSKTVSSVTSSQVDTFVLKELEGIKTDVAKQTTAGLNAKPSSDAVLHTEDMRVIVVQTLNKLEYSLNMINSNNFLDAVTNLCNINVPPVTEPLKTLALLQRQLCEFGVIDYASETLKAINSSIVSEELKMTDIYRRMSSSCTETCLYIRSSKSVEMEISNDKDVHITPNVNLSTDNLVDITSSLMQVNMEIEIAAATGGPSHTPGKSACSISSSIMETFILNILNAKESKQHTKETETIPDRIDVVYGVPTRSSTENSVPKTEVDPITRNTLEEHKDAAPNTENHTEYVIEVATIKQYIVQSLCELMNMFHKLESNNFATVISEMYRANIPQIGQMLELFVEFVSALGIANLGKETVLLLVSNLNDDEVSALDVYHRMSARSTGTTLYIQTPSSMTDKRASHSGTCRHILSSSVTLSTDNLVDITTFIMEVHTEIHSVKDPTSISNVTSSIFENFLLDVLETTQPMPITPRQSSCGRCPTRITVILSNANRSMDSMNGTTGGSSSSQSTRPIETFINKHLKTIDNRDGDNTSSACSIHHTTLHTEMMKEYILKNLKVLQESLIDMGSNSIVDAVQRMHTNHNQPAIPLQMLGVLKSVLERLNIANYGMETINLIMINVENEELKTGEIYGEMSFLSVDTGVYVRTVASTLHEKLDIPAPRSCVEHCIVPNIHVSSEDMTKMTASLMLVLAEIDMHQTDLSESILETFVLSMLKTNQATIPDRSEASSLPNIIKVLDSDTVRSIVLKTLSKIRNSVITEQSKNITARVAAIAKYFLQEQSQTLGHDVSDGEMKSFVENLLSHIIQMIQLHKINIADVHSMTASFFEADLCGDMNKEGIIDQPMCVEDLILKTQPDSRSGSNSHLTNISPTKKADTTHATSLEPTEVEIQDPRDKSDTVERQGTDASLDERFQNKSIASLIEIANNITILDSTEIKDYILVSLTALMDDLHTADAKQLSQSLFGVFTSAVPLDTDSASMLHWPKTGDMSDEEIDKFVRYVLGLIIENVKEENFKTNELCRILSDSHVIGNVMEIKLSSSQNEAEKETQEVISSQDAINEALKDENILLEIATQMVRLYTSKGGELSKTKEKSETNDVEKPETTFCNETSFAGLSDNIVDSDEFKSHIMGMLHQTKNNLDVIAEPDLGRVADKIKSYVLEDGVLRYKFENIAGKSQNQKEFLHECINLIISAVENGELKVKDLCTAFSCTQLHCNLTPASLDLASKILVQEMKRTEDESNRNTDLGRKQASVIWKSDYMDLKRNPLSSLYNLASSKTIMSPEEFKESMMHIIDRIQHTIEPAQIAILAKEWATLIDADDNIPGLLDVMSDPNSAENKTFFREITTILISKIEDGTLQPELLVDGISAVHEHANQKIPSDCVDYLLSKIPFSILQDIATNIISAWEETVAIQGDLSLASSDQLPEPVNSIMFKLSDSGETGLHKIMHDRSIVESDALKNYILGGFIELRNNISKCKSGTLTQQTIDALLASLPRSSSYREGLIQTDIEKAAEHVVSILDGIIWSIQNNFSDLNDMCTLLCSTQSEVSLLDFSNSDDGIQADMTSQLASRVLKLHDTLCDSGEIEFPNAIEVFTVNLKTGGHNQIRSAFEFPFKDSTAGIMVIDSKELATFLTTKLNDLKTNLHLLDGDAVKGFIHNIIELALVGPMPHWMEPSNEMTKKDIEWFASVINNVIEKIEHKEISMKNLCKIAGMSVGDSGFLKYKIDTKRAVDITPEQCQNTYSEEIKVVDSHALKEYLLESVNDIHECLKNSPKSSELKICLLKMISDLKDGIEAPQSDDFVTDMSSVVKSAIPSDDQIRSMLQKVESSLNAASQVIDSTMNQIVTSIHDDQIKPIDVCRKASRSSCIVGSEPSSREALNDYSTIQLPPSVIATLISKCLHLCIQADGMDDDSDEARGMSLTGVTSSRLNAFMLKTLKKSTGGPLSFTAVDSTQYRNYVLSTLRCLQENLSTMLNVEVVDLAELIFSTMPTDNLEIQELERSATLDEKRHFIKFVLDIIMRNFISENEKSIELKEEQGLMHSNIRRRSASEGHVAVPRSKPTQMSAETLANIGSTILHQQYQNEDMFQIREVISAVDASHLEEFVGRCITDSVACHSDMSVAVINSQDMLCVVRSALGAMKDDVNHMTSESQLECFSRIVLSRLPALAGGNSTIESNQSRTVLHSFIDGFLSKLENGDIKIFEAIRAFERQTGTSDEEKQEHIEIGDENWIAIAAELMTCFVQYRGERRDIEEDTKYINIIVEYIKNTLQVIGEEHTENPVTCAILLHLGQEGISENMELVKLFLTVAPNYTDTQLKLLIETTIKRLVEELVTGTTNTDTEGSEVSSSHNSVAEQVPVPVEKTPSETDALTTLTSDILTLQQTAQLPPQPKSDAVADTVTGDKLPLKASSIQVTTSKSNVTKISINENVLVVDTHVLKEYVLNTLDGIQQDLGTGPMQSSFHKSLYEAIKSSLKKNRNIEVCVDSVKVGEATVPMSEFIENIIQQITRAIQMEQVKAIDLCRGISTVAGRKSNLCIDPNETQGEPKSAGSDKESLTSGTELEELQHVKQELSIQLMTSIASRLLEIQWSVISERQTKDHDSATLKSGLMENVISLISHKIAKHHSDGHVLSDESLTEVKDQIGVVDADELKEFMLNFLKQLKEELEHTDSDDLPTYGKREDLMLRLSPITSQLPHVYSDCPLLTLVENIIHNISANNIKAIDIFRNMELLSKENVQNVPLDSRKFVSQTVPSNYRDVLVHGIRETKSLPHSPLVATSQQADLSDLHHRKSLKECKNFMEQKWYIMSALFEVREQLNNDNPTDIASALSHVLNRTRHVSRSFIHSKVQEAKIANVDGAVLNEVIRLIESDDIKTEYIYTGVSDRSRSFTDDTQGIGSPAKQPSLDKHDGHTTELLNIASSILHVYEQIKLAVAEHPVNTEHNSSMQVRPSDMNVETLTKIASRMLQLHQELQTTVDDTDMDKTPSKAKSDFKNKLSLIIHKIKMGRLSLEQIQILAHSMSLVIPKDYQSGQAQSLSNSNDQSVDRILQILLSLLNACLTKKLDDRVLINIMKVIDTTLASIDNTDNTDGQQPSQSTHEMENTLIDVLEHIANSLSQTDEVYTHDEVQNAVVKKKTSRKKLPHQTDNKLVPDTAKTHTRKPVSDQMTVDSGASKNSTGSKVKTKGVNSQEKGNEIGTVTSGKRSSRSSLKQHSSNDSVSAAKKVSSGSITNKTVSPKKSETKVKKSKSRGDKMATSSSDSSSKNLNTVEAKVPVPPPGRASNQSSSQIRRLRSKGSVTSTASKTSETKRSVTSMSEVNRKSSIEKSKTSIKRSSTSQSSNDNLPSNRKSSEKCIPLAVNKSSKTVTESSTVENTDKAPVFEDEVREVKSLWGSHTSRLKLRERDEVKGDESADRSSKGIETSKSEDTEDMQIVGQQQ